MDRGAWWATVRRFTKSWTQLKQLGTHAGPHSDCAVSVGHRGNLGADEDTWGPEVVSDLPRITEQLVMKLNLLSQNFGFLWVMVELYPPKDMLWS